MLPLDRLQLGGWEREILVDKCSRVGMFGEMSAVGWDCLVDECNRLGLLSG